MWGVGVLGLVGLGAWYWMQGANTNTTGGGPVAFRKATATSGKLESTLRLAGVTGAEKFVSLIVPQLRGSRGSGGRDGGIRGASFSGGGSQNVAARSGGNTTLGGSTGGGGSTSMAGGGGRNLSTAMRAATSRGGSSGGGARSSGGGGASSSSSAAMGAEGLGSSSGSLGQGMGGGGGSSGGGGGGGGGGMMSMMGGGGGGDYALILQSLTPSGTMVKKGQTVAEFDRQYMLQRLDDYRSSVAQSEASVKKMYAELEVTKKAREQNIANAKAALDKARLDLKTLPVLSAIDSERVKLAAEEAEARYKQLQSEIRFYNISDQAQIKNTMIEFEQAKAELKRAEANADRLIMKAPLDGLAVVQTIFRGSEMAQIQNGDQLYPGQFFMSVVDPSSMVINASVNQVDVERLRIGAKARVRFDAYPDLQLPARLYSVGGVPKTGGNRVNFVKEIPVRLKLDAMDPRVIPDLSVSIDILVENEEAQTIVPLDSVFEEGGGKPYVFVQNANGGWDRREVELGLKSFTHVVVRSGLKPKEVVAVDRPPDKPGEIPRQTT
jgi:HlyD family secretion protein